MIRLYQFFLFSTLLLPALPAFAQNGEGAVDCGGYTFTMPPGYELRHAEHSEAKFNQTITINELLDQKDQSKALVYCLREKKTEYRTFALPRKERINLLTAPRNGVQLLISATEDVWHEGMWFKFNLLEEKSANSREIRDRERFMVVIEADAVNDDYHTMLFIGDFRKTDDFFNAEEYRVQVTGTAIQIMDSIKKPDYTVY